MAIFGDHIWQESEPVLSACLPSLISRRKKKKKNKPTERLSEDFPVTPVPFRVMSLTYEEFLQLAWPVPHSMHCRPVTGFSECKFPAGIRGNCGSTYRTGKLMWVERHWIPAWQCSTDLSRGTVQIGPDHRVPCAYPEAGNKPGSKTLPENQRISWLFLPLKPPWLVLFPSYVGHAQLPLCPIPSAPREFWKPTQCVPSHSFNSICLG